jgi:hypothetical protein
MNLAHLTLERPRQEGSDTVLGAVLQHSDKPGCRLWWRIPSQWQQALTPWADPFVVGLLFPMMQGRTDVMVEGTVSPSLLANLEQWMAIWQAWRPGRYTAVEIRAREETEAPPPAVRGEAILPFSCGVDSSFTVHQHCSAAMGRRNQRITAGMVMNGFDIRLDQENGQAMYEELLRGARAMLASRGVECIPVVSNFHDLATTWGDSFGTHLASGLRLLAGRFDTALIANDVPHTRLEIIWGSHPVTQPFLGSRHFQVVDDGGEVFRFRKIQALADWPQAVQHLRVCYENPGSHTNCCRCEKCIRTMLAFRAAGVARPAAFSKDVDDRRIQRVRFHHEYIVRHWMEIVEGAKSTGQEGTSWVKAIHTAIRRNKRRWWWRRVKRRVLPWMAHGRIAY